MDVSFFVTGEFMGSLSGFKAHELGAVAIKEVLTRAKISTPEDVDEVILGQVIEYLFEFDSSLLLF